MTGASDEETSLRAYLLGELPPGEQRRIEERLLLDSDYVELLMILEEELIDSYVSDTLSERDRKQFQKHFLISPERRRKLRMAKALRRYINNRPPVPASTPVSRPWSNVFWRQPLHSPAWRSAIAAVLVLGFGLAMWRTLLYQSPVDKGRHALQAALHESPIEARIAGFNWTPPSITLGGQPKAVPDNLSMERAFFYFSDAIEEMPGPDSQYALGQFYLAKGDLNKAIEQFSLALEGMPKNAKLHNDMGAALLAMANQETAKAGQPKDSDSQAEYLVQSLEHLDQALELDHSLLEALFNRALCRQRMQLLPQAEADWQAYLSRDASSPWAEEARRHLGEIEDQNQKRSQSKEETLQEFLNAYQTGDRETAWKVVSQNRDVTSDKLIWWQLLDDYFKLHADGRLAEANARIEALRYVGNLELHLGKEDEQPQGDSYISDLAEFYRAASPSQQAASYEAHKRINEGMRLYLTDQNEEALGPYTEARNIFAGIRDQGEAMLTDLLIGFCRMRNGDMAQSGPLFERLVGECREKGYRWLLAQSLYALGAVQDSQAEHSKALENTNQALQISEAMSDVYNTQRNLTQIADQYRKLGNYKLATTYVNRCFKQMSVGWSGNRQMWRNCDEFTQVLSARRLHAAAAAYATEALRLAFETKEPAFIYVSYIHLGLMRSKQQDYAEAIHLVQLGFDAAGYDQDRAYASLQLGHLHGQTNNWRQALSDYDQSLKYIDSAEALAGFNSDTDTARKKTNRLPALRYDARKGRLFCLFAQGDDVLANEELTRTLGLLERHRESIQEEQNRNTFFNVEQSVYDAAIDFKHSRRNDDQAVFEYSELSRARSLWDLTTAHAQVVDGEPQGIRQPVSLAEAQRRLPDQTQLIEYVVLDNKLLICLVSKSEFSVKEVSISLSELTDKVLNFRRAILRNTTVPTAQAQELYNLLIKGIELSLDKGKQICIVPDKVLNNLPFRALVSPASGSYLVEDYQVGVAPSATIYLWCSEQTKHTADRNHEHLLAVGDPAFDRTEFSSFPPLPSTRQQVEKIKELYQSPTVLTDNSAREEAVKREMEEADVIHLASHYVVYEGDPMNSRLLLAQEPPDRSKSDSSAGFLRADEVYALNLRHAPLVILAACESGVEHYYNGEGMIGMSRVFIAAGAPVVVASLWPVDAYATDTLMIDFHRHRKLEGRSTSAALRLAQLDMLRDPAKKHPYYWAGFTTIGGQTDF